MDSSKAQYNQLLKALLPKDLFEYFDIKEVKTDLSTLNVYLDELNSPPDTYKSSKLISKGFYDPVIIQDFPIRERAVYLHVRRRKWIVEASGKVVSKSWDLTAKGSRYTKGFANFLKELLRY